MTLTILDEVDTIIRRALEEHDPYIALRFGSDMQSSIRISGVALAKLLYELRHNWQEFGIDDNFFDVVEGEMGVPISTADKYSRMWEVVFVESGISDAIKQRLIAKPIKSLLLLPAYVSNGETNWDSIIGIENHNELRRFIRGERGEATSSKTALLIKVDMRTGQLYAKQGDVPFAPFGLLKLDTGNPVINKAVDRLLNSAGVMRT